MINLKTNLIKSQSNHVGEISLRKDNILTFVPHSFATKTDLDTLKSDLKTYIEWTKSTGPLPFLSDNRNMKHLSTQERLYIQQNIHLFASKIAIIVNGGLSTFFFNIMTHLNPPRVPMKAFSDTEKALKWLKE